MVLYFSFFVLILDTVSLMGPSRPFQSFTKRATTESESKSFENSVKSSGVSTASKSVSTRSRSTKGGYNSILAGAKANRSSSTQNTNERKNEKVDSAERQSELSSQVTQAFVTEFTFMPMKTFRLQEGGLALSQYSYYRLRKCFDFLSHFVPIMIILQSSKICFWFTERITADKDAEGNKITDAVLKDTTRRRRAREFLRNFGSHIPFGKWNEY